jgi:metal-dependent amidase/aminoacylase/carboxypeptidase family protein
MLDLIHVRHQLHTHPELSGQEIQTSKKVVELLKKMGVSKIYTGFSQHSIVAEIDGREAGKTLLFRCELDALPIQEANDFAHKSVNSGVSHKCGHDGHTATMFSNSFPLILRLLTTIYPLFRWGKSFAKKAFLRLRLKVFR